jgi:hypothetical protein
MRQSKEKKRQSKLRACQSEINETISTISTHSGLCLRPQSRKLGRKIHPSQRASPILNPAQKSGAL